MITTQNLTIEEKLKIKQLAGLINVINTVSSGNTSLTSTSGFIHVITGSASGFSISLADATTFTEAGVCYEFHNQATASVVIKNNAGTPLYTLDAGTSVKILVTDVSTSNGSYSIQVLLSVAQKEDITKLKEIHQDTKEPTGFVDRSQSTISFNESTRQFSIAPVSTSYEIYVNGVKITISGTLTLTIPNTTQTYFIYIDNAGSLNYVTTFDTNLLSDYAYVAYISWNATSGKAIVFGEERHGTVMDTATHAYLHNTRGTQLVSGGAISGIVGGDGSSNSHAQIGISNMVINDEDISITINHAATPTNPFEQYLNGIAKIPLYYRSGASGEWNKLTATDYPVKFGTSLAQYNKLDTGSWSLADASISGKFLITYVFATNNIYEPVIGILGQDEYLTYNAAFTQGVWDNIQFGTLPFHEMKLLYRLIYTTATTYSNSVKSAMYEITDLRYGTDREVTAVPSITDHGNLSGLSDDDHVQYLLANGTRAMTGNLNMGTNNVANAGTYNSVTVEGHAARHLPSGADPLTTGTPVATGDANSAGTANSFSKSDHVHKTVVKNFSIMLNNTVTTTNTSTTNPATLLTLTTPDAGDYILVATANMSNSNSNTTVRAWISIGGVLDTSTRADMTRGNNTTPLQYMVTGLFTLNGTQDVSIRWSVSNNTGSCNLRSISLIKVG